MGSVDISPGFAFLNVFGDTPHIWVVASSPNENDVVVLLMLSSLRAGADTACVMGPEDYSVLVRKTVVVYALSETQTTSWIREKIGSGFLKPKARVPVGTLDRVQRGALSSKRTPRRIKKLIRGSLHLPEDQA